ncbi:uncharacterized protein [Palaemon carinicauda]|uniref:uncharacterized protein n=1 Tax=Palaemon carinicauda TaxID=392227 RepID=UPI0035B60AEA
MMTHLNFSSVKAFPDPPSFVEDYAVPYPEARRKDFESKPYTGSHDSLEEIDLDDKLQGGSFRKSPAKGASLRALIIIQTMLGSIMIQRVTTLLMSYQKIKMLLETIPLLELRGNWIFFDIMIKNAVTTLVLREIRNITSLYKNYFHRFYNRTITDFENILKNDEPSNIIELVDEALSLNDTVEVPGCRMSPVSLFICTIRVFHVGTLPRDIVNNYNEESLKDLVCPCPRPVSWIPVSNVRAKFD